MQPTAIVWGKEVAVSDSFKQCTYSNVIGNEAKMGAFYTEPGHAYRIGRFFSFPEEKTAILEPSIGDGVALSNFLLGAEALNVATFGVELNRNTVEKLEAKKTVDYLLQGDFLSEVKISNSVFPIVFANPPYGTLESGERLETKFIEKLYTYIASEGILVLIIPRGQLDNEKFIKKFFSRFAPLSQYRFDDDEYAKWKQVCIIAKKRHSIGYMRSWLERYQELINQGIPYLPQPEEEVEKIPVPSGSPDLVEYFTTKTFDIQKAVEHLKKSPLYHSVEEKIKVPKYYSVELGQPPVPLKKDFIYLCAVSGGGQGLVGAEDSQDLHLQRGNVKVKVDTTVNEDNNTVTETTFSSVELTIVENSGKITVLS